MSNIKIYLTKPKSIKFPILSWLIRLVEKTKYSHVVISWHVNSLERDIFYEATGSGVNFLSWKLFPKKYEVIKCYEIDVKNLKKIAQFCHDNSGYKYAKKQIVGLAIVRLFKLFGKTINNPFKDGNYTQICVETALLILKESGFSVPNDIEDYGLKELEVLLETNNGTIK